MGKDCKDGDFGMRKTLFTIWSVGALCAGAAEVPAELACAAAEGFLRGGETLGADIAGRNVESIAQIALADGGVANVAELEGGGFVIVAGDDGDEPVLAFSDEGALDGEAARVMGMLLAGGRGESRTAANAKWGALLHRRAAATVEGAKKIDDVRVAPLIETAWAQQGAPDIKNDYYYNLYTPEHAPAGCVSVAMAQVMRFHRFPQKGVGAKQFPCYVDDKYRKLALWGQAYAWDAMDLNPHEQLTEDGREAVARLMYDCSVALKSFYTPDATSAYVEDWTDRACEKYGVVNAMEGVFGYAQCLEKYEPTVAEIKNILCANLDAGLPCMMAVDTLGDDASEHEIIADGYGYSGGTLYHHINLGVDGNRGATLNVWYKLPDVHTFDNIWHINHNIMPQSTGAVVSGRVTDSAGKALQGVEVELKSSAAVASATTNEKGIYWFIAPKGDATITAKYGGKYSARKVAAADASWGNDFKYDGSWKDEEENGGGGDDEDEEDTPANAAFFKELNAATVYDGYLMDKTGALAGSVQVKFSKPKGATLTAAIVIQPKGAAKVTVKQTLAYESTAEIKSGALALRVGRETAHGTYNGMTVFLARNIFTSKLAADKQRATDVLKVWQGALVAIAGDGTWSITIAAKGKVKAQGTGADGKKTSVAAQLLAGDDVAVAAIAPTKGNLAGFVLELPLDGGEARIAGDDEATVGKSGTLAAGAKFRIDAAEVKKLIGDSLIETCLPDGLAVAQNGAKWIVANGAKAGKVVFAAGTETVDAAKAGANPAALKLTFTAKTGAFKGSFKVWMVVKGKPKAVAATVAGIMVNGKALGNATIKKYGTIPVSIE